MRIYAHAEQRISRRALIAGAFATAYAAPVRNPRAEAALVRACTRSLTFSLQVRRAGKNLVEYGPRRVATIQSVTKAFTSAAVGLLIRDGKIQSVEQELAEFLPETASLPHGRVQLRHLLSHTSGIADVRDARGNMLPKLNEARDRLALCLTQPKVAEPGAVFQYSNLGPTLLGGAIERLAGESLANYVNRELFEPLGIRPGVWGSDGVGRTCAYADLELCAEDLATFGQLILADGVWRGQALLPRDWVRVSTGVPSQQITPNLALLWSFEPSRAGDRPASIQTFGDGWQWLVILPKQGIVAARISRMPYYRQDAMAQFPKLVREAYS